MTDLETLWQHCCQQAATHSRYPVDNKGRVKFLFVQIADILDYSSTNIGEFLHGDHTMAHYYLHKRLADKQEIAMLDRLLEKFNGMSEKKFKVYIVGCA